MIGNLLQMIGRGGEWRFSWWLRPIIRHVRFGAISHFFIMRVLLTRSIRG